MGIELAADEVALRLNTVTIEDGIMRSYACGHIATAESNAIISDIATELDDATFKLYPGVAYRHILVVKGHPELLELSYTPPHDISDRPVEGHLPSGPGAELLLDFMARARPLLDNSAVNRCRVADGRLPVTDVWPFWPGVAPTGMVPLRREARRDRRDDERRGSARRAGRARGNGQARGRRRDRGLGQRLRWPDRGRTCGTRRPRPGRDPRGVAGRRGPRG